MTELKTTINGKKYITTRFGASRQLELLPGVLRLVSGPFGTMIETAQGMGDGPIAKLLADKRVGKKVSLKAIDVGAVLKSLAPDAITGGLVAVANELDNGGVELIKDLLRDTLVFKGKKQTDGLFSCSEDFDAAFDDGLHHLVAVLFWVININYAPFLRSNSQKSGDSTRKKDK